MFKTMILLTLSLFASASIFGQNISTVSEEGIGTGNVVGSGPVTATASGSLKGLPSKSGTWEITYTADPGFGDGRVNLICGPGKGSLQTDAVKRQHFCITHRLVVSF